MIYRLYSQSTKRSRWRIVTPNLHGERYQFDSVGLCFDSFEQAEVAALGMRRANAADYKIVPETWRVSGNPLVD